MTNSEYRLTGRVLRKHGACGEGLVQKFDKLWPKGVLLRRATIRRAANRLGLSSVQWFAEHCLSPKRAQEFRDKQHEGFERRIADTESPDRWCGWTEDVEDILYTLLVEEKKEGVGLFAETPRKRRKVRPKT